MHDLKWIENNTDLAQRLLKKRGKESKLDELVELIKKRREIILAGEELKRKRNEINNGLKTAAPREIDERREEMRKLAATVKESDKQLSEVEEAIDHIALLIPNLPMEDVPVGQSAEDNVVVKEVLQKRHFSFTPRDHVELGHLTDTIDMARAAKISGARFSFLKGAGSRLNRALLQFFCDFHTKAGDCELSPPYMVREQAMIGAGAFPKFREDAFKVVGEDEEPYYLIPTAEVPVTNYWLMRSLTPQRFLFVIALSRLVLGRKRELQEGTLEASFVCTSLKKWRWCDLPSPSKQ